MVPAAGNSKMQHLIAGFCSSLAVQKVVAMDERQVLQTDLYRCRRRRVACDKRCVCGACHLPGNCRLTGDAGFTDSWCSGFRVLSPQTLSPRTLNPAPAKPSSLLNHTRRVGCQLLQLEVSLEPPSPEPGVGDAPFGPREEDPRIPNTIRNPDS